MRKILTGLLCAVVAAAAEAVTAGLVSVPYWDPIAKSNCTALCEVVTSATDTFEDGKWYAVTDRITRGTISVNGAAHLILADGANLTVEGDRDQAGLTVQDDKSLVIYGQTGGTGELVATGGRSNGAGIGGGNSGSCGMVTINGGLVTAQGGNNNAGIGGGRAGSGGTVTINGGTVTATGGPGGAGIGNGYNGTGGTVTINGGTVTATGGTGGAGIGGGSTGSSGEVTIRGGMIDARAGSGAENAIGPGGNGTAGSISISGGIFAFKPDSGWLASDCFCVANTDSQTSVKYPWKVICGVLYVNEKGETCVTEGVPIVVNGATTTFDTGWYVVTGRVERGTIAVNGAAHLILADGANLTVQGGENQAGLTVQDDKSLVIYGQTGGTGELVATGGSCGAGIGGGNYGTGGTVTINGGTVTATGGPGAAGIGGGRDRAGGMVTINGGTVMATGGVNSAGIGGGNGGSGGTVTINGGTVTAKAVTNAAGIGGGVYGAWGTVTINGGTVTATGDRGAAGIGAGYESSGGGSVTIRGGMIDARAGDDAKNAIGPGSSGTVGTVSISGGIFATKTDASWLASGYVCVKNTDSQTSATYPWRVMEPYPVPVRFIRGSGVTALLYRTDAGGAFVSFPDGGMELPLGIEIELQVQTEPGFAYRGETRFTVEEADLTKTISAGVPYVNEKGETCVTEDVPTVVDGSTTTLDAGWYMVTGRVERGTITVNGAAHLILVDGATLTVQGVDYVAGMSVPDGKSLVIYGQAGGTGELVANGGGWAAGIGGGYNVAGGTVTINGGTVTARSKHSGAGIGGGSNGAGGTVTINGGTVTASSGDTGAGIGGGFSGAGGTVTINGGTVTATSYDSGAGIGGGTYGVGGNVTVYGGTVTATSYNSGAGIGGGMFRAWGSVTIYGGTVTATGGKDGAGIGSGHQGNPMEGVDCIVTINGGTVTATGGENGAGIGGGCLGAGGNVTIHDGAIDVRAGANVFSGAIGPGANGKSGTIAISGGIFASKTDASWLASGYVCVKNTDSQTSAKYPWRVMEPYPVPVRFIRGSGVTALLYRTDAGGAFVSFPDGGMELPFGIEIELQVQTEPGFAYRGETRFTVEEADLTKTISACVPYVNEKGETCFTEGVPTIVDGSTTTFNAGWYVVRDLVYCETITVNGNAHLILADGCSLVVAGGIRVGAGSALTIYGQSEGTGELTAIGATRCAGIGAGPSGNSGTVAIHGGKIDARAGDGAKDDIGAGGGGTAGPVTITGGVFARRPKDAWIAEGHWISSACPPGTVAPYPWRVLKTVMASVRLTKGTGVGELLFHREGETAFVPFPDGGTSLPIGAWVRIRVRTSPGYYYLNETWFQVETSGLTRTITPLAIKSDGDGSPERPWIVGEGSVAWINGTGGLFVYGEGPMADCIDAYGPAWMAFADDITELTVGGDVTAIGAGAFAGLTNLKKVTVSADQLVTIGDYAFADCWSLADLALPNSLEKIGESAFEYCFDLPACVLPASLREIGMRAFFYCWTLTEIDIPDSVIAIGDQAFAGCSWLLRLGLGSDLVWLGDSAFSDCTEIVAIEIRAEEPPSVGDKAFYLVPMSATLTVPAASVNLYKTAKGWENFNIQPAAGPSNETDEPAAERPTLAARLASAAPGAVGDKPAFEVVREGSVVRVTVRLPKALQGVRYRLWGSTDLTFAKPMEVVRGTANGTGGLELSGTVPDGASCYFKVDVEGGNEE